MRSVRRVGIGKHDATAALVAVQLAANARYQSLQRHRCE